MTITKKQISRGYHGTDPVDPAAAFVDPSNTSGFDRHNGSANSYAQRYDDESGHVRGANHDDSRSHGLRQTPPFELRGEWAGTRGLDALADIIDDAEGMGSGSALLGGGGPLSQSRSGGASPPRYRSRRAPRCNATDR